MIKTIWVTTLTIILDWREQEVTRYLYDIKL